MDYSHLQGWVDDQREVNKVMTSLPFPVFADIHPPMKDSGKGKTVLLHEIVKKVAGYFPVRLQKIGDCFVADSKIQMADGTEKNIQDVCVGEMVITHTSNIKRVTNIIRKKYTGKLCKIQTSCLTREIICTPDHKFITYPYIKNRNKKIKYEQRWSPIISLNIGDYLYVPSLPSLEEKEVLDLAQISKRQIHIEDFTVRQKSSKHTINRFIPIDTKLSWLIGIFAAEGSIDGNSKNTRVTFTLNKTELFLAKKIEQFVTELFNFNVSIRYRISNNVLLVRINNTIIADVFKYLCQGNVYTKELLPKFLLSSKDIKLALLEGWLDGDGYRSQNKYSGSSVSKKLIYQLFNIANSLNIQSRIYNKKAYTNKNAGYFNSKQSNILSLDAITTQKFCLNNFKLNTSQINGRAVKIKSIEIIDADTEVYCLEVEDDHSFICNNVAVHNCVSMGTAGAVDIAKCSDIYIKKERELWVNETSTEDIYSGSRVVIGKGALGHNDGSIGGWACQWISKYGALPRGKYGNVDLSVYDGNRARQWGSPTYGIDGFLLEEIKKHPIYTTSKVSSYEEVRDLIANGYGVIICSNIGFTNKRDKDGFAYKSGSWNHCMYICAVSDEKRPSCLVMNSWGPSWIGGPKTHNQPDGSFWVDADTINQICRQGDSWGISGYEGFKPRKLETRII